MRNITFWANEEYIFFIASTTLWFGSDPDTAKEMDHNDDEDDDDENA